MVKAWKCERCGHVWVPRESDKPKVCPECKSPYWDSPRKKKVKSLRNVRSVMSYIDAFQEFIEKAKRANTHPAKLLVLSEMLKNVFNIELEELIPGIEKKLGSKALGIKCSADLIFTNVIFEIKVDLR